MNGPNAPLCETVKILVSLDKLDEAIKQLLESDALGREEEDDVLIISMRHRAFEAMKARVAVDERIANRATVGQLLLDIVRKLCPDHRVYHSDFNDGPLNDRLDTIETRMNTTQDVAELRRLLDEVISLRLRLEAGRGM